MNRREALRLLAAGAALPLAPHSLLATLREARAFLGTPDAPRTLSPHQFATVKTMAEMILPRTDTPGAADVGATEFIDLILTEWYEEEERARFVSGLSEVDARTQALFGKDFIGCAAVQQAEILTFLGEKMLEEADAVRDEGRQRRGAGPEPHRNFYSTLRRLTLTAYYTSEQGATAELNFQVIPDRQAGCAEIGAGKEDASK